MMVLRNIIKKTSVNCFNVGYLLCGARESCLLSCSTACFVHSLFTLELIRILPFTFQQTTRLSLEHSLTRCHLHILYSHTSLSVSLGTNDKNQSIVSWPTRYRDLVNIYLLVISVAVVVLVISVRLVVLLNVCNFVIFIRG